MQRINKILACFYILLGWVGSTSILFADAENCSSAHIPEYFQEKEKPSMRLSEKIQEIPNISGVQFIKSGSSCLPEKDKVTVEIYDMSFLDESIFSSTYKAEKTFIVINISEISEKSNLSIVKETIPNEYKEGVELVSLIVDNDIDEYRLTVMTHNAKEGTFLPDIILLKDIMISDLYRKKYIVVDLAKNIKDNDLGLSLEKRQVDDFSGFSGEGSGFTVAEDSNPTTSSVNTGVLTFGILGFFIAVETAWFVSSVKYENKKLTNGRFKYALWAARGVSWVAGPGAVQDLIIHGITLIRKRRLAGFGIIPLLIKSTEFGTLNENLSSE